MNTEEGLPEVESRESIRQAKFQDLVNGMGDRVLQHSPDKCFVVVKDLGRISWGFSSTSIPGARLRMGETDPSVRHTSRQYFDLLPDNERLGVVGILRFTNGKLNYLETRGEEVNTDKLASIERREFYPQVNLTFPRLRESDRDSRNPNLLTVRINYSSTTRGMVRVAYDTAFPTRLPQLEMRGDEKILDSLVPKDKPSKVTLLRALLKVGPQQVIIKGSTYDISLIDGERVFVRRSRPQGGKVERTDEITFPLAIPRQTLQEVIQDRFADDLLKDPAKAPEEFDKWVTTDWPEVFGIHIERFTRPEE